eukprot:Phypoly_transcript_15421.p1 GENE.Phypoly_transcript_15421~~Phypoly_transcript_15421.p1  ORF type:complete len:177 (+),score=9.14 Phypoly_transcript_15421:92-622(+)
MQSGVYGHAALVSPKPWWWAASRDRPCGGANYTAIPKAIWPVGSNQSIEWWVIAGDGEGQVHVKLNTAGTTDFSTNTTQWLTVSQPKIASTGYFWLTALVPNVKCTGPNDTCTIQFYTDSGGGCLIENDDPLVEDVRGGTSNSGSTMFPFVAYLPARMHCAFIAPEVLLGSSDYFQ